MDPRRPIALSLFVLFAQIVAADGRAGSAIPAEGAAPQRIVSLAPSITEALFAVSLGTRVVGVTRYCRFPPEAQSIAQVGGYMNPSYEALASLRPDLVPVLPEHEDIQPHLRALGVP